jgi:hypothetical protein
MRVIARRERPHRGAQLRLTDHNGWRTTCLATPPSTPPDTRTEVRHRQRARARARAENRIRNLKDTGLRNLPFHRWQDTTSQVCQLDRTSLSINLLPSAHRCPAARHVLSS